MPSDRMLSENLSSHREVRPIGDATGRGAFEAAWDHLNSLLPNLEKQPASPERDVQFVNASIEYARACFVVGKGFGELGLFLKKALDSADRIGDRRSAAMIKLHLGRVYYFGEQRPLALDSFEQGKKEVEALGDEDILTNASELIGLYFFIQGRFSEAMSYFEQAAKKFESGEHGHSGAMWLCYCAAFLGQYHKAIGTLDYYRRLAMERQDHSLAATLRAVLGIFLVRIKKTKEAGYHLSGALQESIQTQNYLASYFAKGGLAFHHMMEGRLEESHKWMDRAVKDGASAGLVRQYASPFVLELLYEYHSNGLPQLPHFTFKGECRRLMAEPNIHLQGVALRLRALDALAHGTAPPDTVEADLQRSETLLSRSGDPVQLGKTRIAMARLKIGQGHLTVGRRLAQQAWKGFSGYGDVFYPDDLRRLLDRAFDGKPDAVARAELVEMFSAMIQDLVPSDDPDELLERMVRATNRFFGAERGGIFWFEEKARNRGPKLRAACNLFQSDVTTEEFRTSLSLIFKAFRDNCSHVVRPSAMGTSLPSQIRAMMAVPVMVNDTVRGVLYHDNAYVDDCFDQFAPAQLVRMAQSLSQYIAHMLRFTRRMEQKTTVRLSRMGQVDEKQIIARSPVMLSLLDQVDRIAATDSTILILGETGVGKELLARRIHAGSLRREHPLVVVDPTAIPETLVESELFGHEKGAFTGADRQRAGRLELAHNGSLFIDEVGEIPLTIQVKLLRALQEKAMVRVGGTRTLSSNFRLIVATNRDLAREVNAGRFREDLYYRLNVIPITLPPLRKRGHDILRLARHFVERFCGKYNRPALGLSPETERQLQCYHWPGNVRELENIIERSVLLSPDDTLAISLPNAEKATRGDNHPFDDLPSMEELQRRYIAFVLDQTNGKIAGNDGAAALLGMKRTSLYNRMNKLGMR